MRKYIAGSVSAFAAMTMFSVFGATMPFQSLKVHISEPVHVAQSELPAGDYTVRYIDVGSDVPYLSFQTEKGQPVVFAAMRNPLAHGASSDKTELVFDKSAGELSLSRIEIEGLTYTFEVIGAHAHSHGLVTR